MPIYPVQAELQPKPIICISIAHEDMKTKHMAAIIINAILYYCGYKFSFQGALSKQHQEVFKGLRYWQWDECQTTAMQLALPHRKIREIGHYHPKLVYFGKLRSNEDTPLGLSFANNVHPSQAEFVECTRVQKVLNIITAAYEQSRLFRQIVAEGWKESMGSNRVMSDSFFWQDGECQLIGLAIPKAWTDTWICAQGVNEESASEEEIDGDDDSSENDN